MLQQIPYVAVVQCVVGAALMVKISVAGFFRGICFEKAHVFKFVPHLVKKVDLLSSILAPKFKVVLQKDVQLQTMD